MPAQQPRRSNVARWRAVELYGRAAGSLSTFFFFSLSTGTNTMSLTGELKNLLGNFGIELPPPTSNGTIDPTALAAIIKQKQARYPMQLTAQVAANIKDVVDSVYVPTAPTPVILTDIPLPAGKKNETVIVPVAFAGVVNGKYNVMLDVGAQVFASVAVTNKTATSFCVEFSPEPGTTVKASTFGITAIG
jgi:hypothetical protein